MFRRVLITGFTGISLFALSALAQDSSGVQVQSTTNTTPSGQSQVSTTATLPSKSKSSSSKKKKKSKKADNPIADLGSKQPDKVLFDRAMDSIKHGKYDVARLSLQTLINTYPDSEYVARAKLAIGDSWYNEGGAAAYAQAESEYKDFITFFPNMPEAAEAQMKIANIHFHEMEKADRDPTHALRAEDEYRQMILQFPDSPLIPEAKQRLLEVQEVLARREYDIGHFYYLRESYPAAIARLKSATDTYPLFSGADDALFELGNAYEREIEVIRRSKLSEVGKGVLIKEYNQGAIKAYDRILTQYPLEDRAPEAKKRLQAMKQPIPSATPQAIAADKAQIASRGSMGHISKVMENFHKSPDFSEATKVGEPTLVDPKQASAPEMVRAANDSVRAALGGGGNTLTVERVTPGATPPPNAPIPHSDSDNAAPPAAENAAPANAADTGPINAAPAGTDLKNDLAPAPVPGATSAPATPVTAAPVPAPNQVNDLAGSSAPPSTTQGSAPAAASSSSSTTQAAPADTNTESTSKKKKKHHLLPF